MYDAEFCHSRTYYYEKLNGIELVVQLHNQIYIMRLSTLVAKWKLVCA
ncbi:hypothetical protein LCGC14_1881400 [marine sediment metagenome]|uniref:Uncharacterized protein n=1 Tax=marine sediment metagenome TaxID=412755 RepID=A0A0F9G2A3_9ZZZZ